MKLRMILATILLFTSALSVSANDKVIYGDDDRRDIFDVVNPLFLKLAVSTAAHIPKSKIDMNRAGATAKISGRTLVQGGYCANDPFTNQQAAARCSGFLVGEDLLVTAGHCMRSASDCKGNYWVFDYSVTDPNQDVTTFNHPKSSIYSCKEIISTFVNGSGADYALIKLDKKVTDRDPLEYRTSGKVDAGADIVVIGHPTGLPTKVSDNAIVRNNNPSAYFQSNLDTFGGNSGSAVFNVATGKVEGILVRGERDYKYDSQRGCTTNNTCSNTGCRGEDVTRITEVKGLPGL